MRFINVEQAVEIGEARASAVDLATRHAQFRLAIEPLVTVAFRVLQRLHVGNDEIDDALQIVLVTADRKFDEIPNRAELKAYICAACVNVARDLGRRRVRRTAQSTPLDEEPPSPDADPADLLERKQALAMVQRVLETMLPERREVFVLYELEELTGREIAEHLGLPPGTVASRLRKAREDFRQGIALVDPNESPSGRGT